MAQNALNPERCVIKVKGFTDSTSTLVDSQQLGKESAQNRLNCSYLRCAPRASLDRRVSALMTKWARRRASYQLFFTRFPLEQGPRTSPD